MEKKTILYDNHIKLGAHMMPFGGYLMPIYYHSTLFEHQAVRESCGIFDISHMGQFLIKGKDALEFINFVSTNTILATPQKMTYTLLVDKDGYTIDDLMVYVFDKQKILLVVNASNIDKDFKWLTTLKKDFDLTLENQTDLWSAIAIQGPKAELLIKDIIKHYPLDSMTHLTILYQDSYVLISRSGYTGEDGFEIYGNHDVIKSLWQTLINHFAVPCGLGARDTLRFEANMPLYGHEISESISPIEASLGFAIDFDKKDFIGKDALLNFKANPKRKLVGLELLERHIPRASYKVYKDDAQIGYITTGYLSPTVQKPLAFALIDIKESKLNQHVSVEIRGKKIPAVIRDRKFYKKNNYIKGDLKHE